ncbi:MAG: SDR family NAD(P)-dependent oxidoreductase [Thermomicrobiales bacterium]
MVLRVRADLSGAERVSGESRGCGANIEDRAPPYIRHRRPRNQQCELPYLVKLRRAFRILDRRAERPDRAGGAVELKATGARVQTLQADLATYDSVETIYRAIQADSRPVEAIAINAGVGVGGDFTRRTDLQDELNLIQLNVVSTVHLAKRVLPDMVSARSRARPLHLLDRGADARDVRGGLQRLEGVRAVVRRGATK